MLTVGTAVVWSVSMPASVDPGSGVALGLGEGCDCELGGTLPGWSERRGRSRAGAGEPAALLGTRGWTATELGETSLCGAAGCWPIAVWPGVGAMCVPVGCGRCVEVGDGSGDGCGVRVLGVSVEGAAGGVVVPAGGVSVPVGGNGAIVGFVGFTGVASLGTGTGDGVVVVGVGVGVGLLGWTGVGVGVVGFGVVVVGVGEGLVGFGVVVVGVTVGSVVGGVGVVDVGAGVVVVGSTVGVGVVVVGSTVGVGVGWGWPTVIVRVNVREYVQPKTPRHRAAENLSS